MTAIAMLFPLEEFGWPWWWYYREQKIWKYKGKTTSSSKRFIQRFTEINLF
jgi:hypothetical protein